MSSFLIVGAGAIGAVLGGCLAEHPSNRVTLLARGAHLSAMRRAGLTLHLDQHDAKRSPRTLVCRNLQLVGSLEEIQPQVAFDFVVLSVKAHQLGEVARDAAWGTLIGPSTSILTVQNGLPWWTFLREEEEGPFKRCRLTCLDPDGALERAFPAKQIVGGVALPAARLDSPGCVYHENGWGIHLGRGFRAEQLAARLVEAGFEAPINQDYAQEIWIKLLGSAIFNPVSALTGATLVQLTTLLPELCVQGMEEVRAVARAAGVQISASNEKRLKGAARVGMHKTSMLMDVEAGKTDLEIAALLTSVLEVASWTDNAKPPVLSLIHALLKAKVAVMRQASAAQLSKL
jgi:2-dehydropantoate 2-reductase